MSVSDYTIEMSSEHSTHCACCGHVSRSIWGRIDRNERTVAAYWVRWTKAHFEEYGADFDLAIGPWGDETSKEDRVAVRLLFRKPEEEAPSVMVVDATDSQVLRHDIAAVGLRRDEVIGTPMAPIVFALFDAIYLQDSRLFAD